MTKLSTRIGNEQRSAYVQWNSPTRTTIASKGGQIDHMPRGQHDRLAAHIAVEFEERDHRAAERDRTDGDAEAHFDPAVQRDVGARRVENPERCRD